MNTYYRTIKSAYFICIVLAIAVLGYYFITNKNSVEVSKPYLLIVSLPFTVGGFLHFLIMYKTSPGNVEAKFNVKKWIAIIGLILWTILIFNFYVIFLL